MDKKKTLKILLIDGDEEIFNVLNKYFSYYNIDLKWVKNSNEALKILRPEDKKDFDLILTDIVMTGMSGIALLDIIHREKLSKAKVCFVSAKNDKFMVEKALSRGACGYIFKPFTKKCIFSGLNKIIDFDSYKKSTTKLINWELDPLNIPEVVKLKGLVLNENGIMVESNLNLSIGSKIELTCGELREFYGKNVLICEVANVQVKKDSKYNVLFNYYDSVDRKKIIDKILKI